MRVLSVCSGIGAAELAFGRCGMTTIASAEIEAFPSAVLAERFPGVPNWGDMTRFQEWPDADVDVLVGGTPCQSFSVAGLRKGLADPRGNLALTYLAIADRYRPEWLVWENVPGVLSSSGGRDFGAFLGALAELGYGFAYRVLDAQYFGVPQRRRRVFVVGHPDWRRAAAVLFERESLQGHPPPRREAGEVAPTIPARSSGGGGLGTDFDCDGGLIASIGDTAHCLNAGGKQGLQDQHVNQGCPLFVPVAFQSKASAEQSMNPGPVTPSLDRCKSDGMAVAYDVRGREGGAQMEGPHDTANIRASSGGSSRSYVIQERAVAENPDAGPQGAGFREGVAYTLEARHRVQAVNSGMQVRRLTPVECERLQGFPDNWTDVPYRNKPTADGPRYKALGNSMAVPVMEWIGQRIVMVNEMEAA